MITHLEPDILECEVKWALGSIATNKASRDDGIPVELFQILKDKPRQHIKKQRYYFADKGLSSQSFFPVVVYGCESWTIKKAECQRTDAFE